MGSSRQFPSPSSRPFHVPPTNKAGRSSSDLCGLVLLSESRLLAPPVRVRPRSLRSFCAWRSQSICWEPRAPPFARNSRAHRLLATLQGACRRKAASWAATPQMLVGGRAPVASKTEPCKGTAAPAWRQAALGAPLRQDEPGVREPAASERGKGKPASGPSTGRGRCHPGRLWGLRRCQRGGGRMASNEARPRAARGSRGAAKLCPRPAPAQQLVRELTAGRDSSRGQRRKKAPRGQSHRGLPLPFLPPAGSRAQGQASEQHRGLGA